MRALLVIDDVELVDLCLELFDASRDGLLVQPAEQGLVESFVLALRGRLLGLPGDRLDSQRGHVDDELALHPTAHGVQRGSVVGEQTLWSSATRGALVEHRDQLSGLAARHVRGDREARMIVLELDITQVRPLVRTYWVASSSSTRSVPDRRTAAGRAEGRFLGSSRATPSSRKIVPGPRSMALQVPSLSSGRGP